MKNFYKILKIERTASFSEIRKAYRKLALESHPDVNNSSAAKEQFQEVHEAYSVLKNPFSKIQYDQLYDHHFQQTKTNGFDRRKDRFQNTVDRKIKKGSDQSAKNETKTEKRFIKKTKRSGFWDGLYHVLEFIVTILFPSG